MPFAGADAAGLEVSALRGLPFPLAFPFSSYKYLGCTSAICDDLKVSKRVVFFSRTGSEAIIKLDFQKTAMSIGTCSLLFLPCVYSGTFLFFFVLWYVFVFFTPNA